MTQQFFLFACEARRQSPVVQHRKGSDCSPSGAGMGAAVACEQQQCHQSCPQCDHLGCREDVDVDGFLEDPSLLKRHFLSANYWHGGDLETSSHTAYDLELFRNIPVYRHKVSGVRVWANAIKFGHMYDDVDVFFHYTNELVFIAVATEVSITEARWAFLLQNGRAWGAGIVVSSTEPVS